jgi:hypothetical protein
MAIPIVTLNSSEPKKARVLLFVATTATSVLLDIPASLIIHWSNKYKTGENLQPAGTLELETAVCFRQLRAAFGALSPAAAPKRLQFSRTMLAIGIPREATEANLLFLCLCSYSRRFLSVGKGYNLGGGMRWCN